MKIAFIHNEKKVGTGAYYINDLISLKLKERGVMVKHFYPSTNLIDTPANLKGLSNILFFHSLLEHRKEILQCDLIQGTTYTPLTFLAYDIPVVSHFGSTTQGFLDKVPLAFKVNEGTRKFWYDLKKNGVLKEVNLKTKRPLRDIAEIEHYVANRSTKVVATSMVVAKELKKFVKSNSHLSVIHNAIEDYWFLLPYKKPSKNISLVFLGRLGADSFNLKLKGVDRLFDWYSHFPDLDKHTFAITTNELLTNYLNERLPNHVMHANIIKDQIPTLLNKFSGSIFFVSSRYEGFSLSLIEGMSQGLIPIVYSVGVASEIIKNGVNGFLVSNQSQVIRYTKKILADPDMRKRMSLEAYKTAQNFTADKLVDQLSKLYDQILNEAPVKRRMISLKERFDNWRDVNKK